MKYMIMTFGDESAWDTLGLGSAEATWSEQEVADHFAAMGAFYADLAASLTALSTRRREVRERVERLRAMEALLAPFKAQEEGDDKKSGVQQNLVTRNGELEKELERMRFLLVRVAGRVAQFPESEQNREANDDDDMLMQDMDVVERAKVDRLLDNF